MNEPLYVATDSSGVDHQDDKAISWNLPTFDGVTWHEGEATRAVAGDLVLRSTTSLLDALDEQIFVARALDGGGGSDANGVFSTTQAVLVSETAWNPTTAAQFALDCAEHVSIAFGSVELPYGSTIAETIADARKVIAESSSDAEHRTGRLARLAAARRLKRRGEEISDLALEILSEDEVGHLDALDDVRYAATASIVDAVLSAAEAVRHIALPRHIAAREAVTDTRGTDAPSTSSTIISTPWGPIAFGADHQQPYAPAWAAARDAARRARDAAETDTESSETKERAWQAARLGEYLNSR